MKGLRTILADEGMLKTAGTPLLEHLAAQTQFYCEKGMGEADGFSTFGRVKITPQGYTFTCQYRAMGEFHDRGCEVFFMPNYSNWTLAVQVSDDKARVSEHTSLHMSDVTFQKIGEAVDALLKKVKAATSRR